MTTVLQCRAGFCFLVKTLVEVRVQYDIGKSRLRHLLNFFHAAPEGIVYHHRYIRWRIFADARVAVLIKLLEDVQWHHGTRFV